MCSNKCSTEEKLCIKCNLPGEFYTRPDNGKEMNVCKKCTIKASCINKRNRRLGIAKPGEEAKADEATITCNRCSILKPESMFSPRPDRPGHFYKICKPCRNESEAERRLRKINVKKKYFNHKEFADNLTDGYFI